MTGARVAVVGSFVQDQMMLLGELPSAGETRIGFDLTTGCGGKGFNQAVACARQEVATIFIGAVGKDAAAEEMRKFAKQAGLALAEEEIEDVSTGIAQIQVSKSTSQNQIGVFLGANDRLSLQHIKINAEFISKARILVCQLESNLESTETSLKLARSKGVTTILNPAPINDAFKREILESVDVLIPNESEFAYLYNKLTGLTLAEDYWQSDSKKLRELCLKIDVPTVIITLGKAGAFVSHNKSANCYQLNAEHELKTKYQSNDENSFYKVPAIEVKALDTTGAGDAFAGGFAAGFLKYSDDFQAAVRYATAVAALSVTKTGTAPAMPLKSEVERLLRI